MKTLQELADFLGMYIAMDEDREMYAYESEPAIRPYEDDWQTDGYWYSKRDEHHIPSWMVSYDGSWESSLTFPKEK